MPTNFFIIAEAGEVCFGAYWRAPMAKALGTTERTLNRWERGEAEPPKGLSAEELRRLQRTELTEDLWNYNDLTKKLRNVVRIEAPKMKKYLEQSLSEHDARLAKVQAELDKLK